MWELCIDLDLDLMTTQQTVKQMDSNFLWSIIFSAIEMTSKFFNIKWNHEPQASGFASFSHFHVIFIVGKSINH